MTKLLFDAFDEILASANQDLIQENANTDGRSPAGMMGLFASESAKQYAERFLRPDVSAAFQEGYIHIHDFDYYASGTTTCCQLPLGALLEKGFEVGGCSMRSPQTISAAMALTSILIQGNQNMQHGGQSIPNFDFDLAPYVERSFVRHLETVHTIHPQVAEETARALAMGLTEKETYQAAEAFIHNANSMLCRNGMQVPFISINYGLDSSGWGRMVSKSIMKATKAGLGDGSTPIFPIHVFKLKAGVSAEKGDPNYDLYWQALETTASRLFPNFLNVDAPFNLQYYKEGDPNTHVATMGCRTRVIADVNGDDTPVGRGNLSFTTLNLPMIAYEAKGSGAVFFSLLDSYMDVATTQLRDRLHYQQSRKAAGFSLLYRQGVWKGGEALGPNDEIGDVLKTGTLSLGFIGLAEALIALVGEHHGESESAWQLGYEIIARMRKRMDQLSAEEQLNWTLLATPAESYCGKALRAFKKKYGTVPGISDREYFTNSNHIPVWYAMPAVRKLKLEAPFHALTNAGHISYIELDGEAAKNIEALDVIVQAMRVYEVGYGSINHPVDRCQVCNHAGIIYEETCPACGGNDISRIRRITGYLVGDQKKWNRAKAAEEKERIQHGTR